MAEQLLNSRMVAERLAISEPQVRKLAAKGVLAYVRLGRSVRFRASEVEALAHQGLAPRAEQDGAGQAGPAGV